MIDSQALDELPVVRKIRETVRNWWRLEVGLTDSRGYVAEHARGVVTPPHNNFCKAALASAEGFRLCNKSVENASQQVKETGGEGARLTMPCHLGFPLAMAPIVFEGRLYGTVFTGGFVIAGHADDQRIAIEHSARMLNLRVPPPAEGETDVPVLSERDLHYLGDLLETIASELATLVVEYRDPRRFGDLIGKSPKMQRLYGMLDKVSQSDATVLIMGENGTGKEVVARAVHSMGPRAQRPFVATNCSALNDNLLETELFGHIKGAFTGAIRAKDGLFKVADGGTLFLDEVGDTSPAMQVKLLRVLQEGTFMPVGATEPVSVDVRVVAATNRPLQQMVERGDFREDLYYRLNVIGLDIPPLRDRKMDLPLLYEYFLARLKSKSKTPGNRKVLSPEVVKAFWEYDWPGNVRQLENEIERLVVLSGDSPTIGPAFLSPAVRRFAKPGAVEEPTPVREGATLDEAVREVERRVIRAGLIRTGWNKSRLARELGLSRTTLIKKVRELGLEEASAAGG